MREHFAASRAGVLALLLGWLVKSVVVAQTVLVGKALPTGGTGVGLHSLVHAGNVIIIAIFCHKSSGGAVWTLKLHLAVFLLHLNDAKASVLCVLLVDVDVLAGEEAVLAGVTLEDDLLVEAVVQEVAAFVQEAFATQVTQPLCLFLGPALLAEQSGFAERRLGRHTHCLSDSCDLH